jgi:hypothetical protein
VELDEAKAGRCGRGLSVRRARSSSSGQPRTSAAVTRRGFSARPAHTASLVERGDREEHGCRGRIVSAQAGRNGPTQSLVAVAVVLVAATRLFHQVRGLDARIDHFGEELTTGRTDTRESHATQHFAQGATGSRVAKNAAGEVWPNATPSP